MKTLTTFLKFKLSIKYETWECKENSKDAIMEKMEEEKGSKTPSMDSSVDIHKHEVSRDFRSAALSFLTFKIQYM